jgi:hypothetical protein
MYDPFELTGTAVLYYPPVYPLLALTGISAAKHDYIEGPIRSMVLDQRFSTVNQRHM